MSSFSSFPFGALPALLLPWYASAARPLPWRETREPYRVWISEIMLQQTRVAAVLGYYARFLSALPDVAALAAVEEERLLKLWEGLGYYSRARNLKRAAGILVREYGGKFPESYAALRALPGIGEYTAGAIASICFDLPTPAIDGNVLRIAARLADCGDCVDAPESKRALRATLAAAYPSGQCGAFTQALMELGATVCLPNGAPLCGCCPAASLCLGRARGTAKSLPVRAKKQPRRREDRTVLLLVSEDGRTALCKRPEHGLLSGLWELPNVPGVHSPQEAASLAESFGAKPLRLTASAEYTHVFTHVEWHMTCYRMECAAPDGAAPDGAAPEGLVWADAAGLSGTYALPSAFQKALRLSRKG